MIVLGFGSPARPPRAKGGVGDGTDLQAYQRVAVGYSQSHARALLEGRTEALAGTFNAQKVASTLWAYATMGVTVYLLHERKVRGLLHHFWSGRQTRISRFLSLSLSLSFSLSFSLSLGPPTLIPFSLIERFVTTFLAFLYFPALAIFYFSGSRLFLFS